jgi:NADH-quinone oxidoreductase subunit A
MPIQYIPILIFAVLAVCFPGAIFAILRRLRRHSEDSMTVLDADEREIPPADPIGARESERFFTITALFVIFDIVIVFLCPWAIRFSQMGWYGLVSMTVFLGTLLSGYAWLYKKGALYWVEGDQADFQSDDIATGPADQPRL